MSGFRSCRMTFAVGSGFLGLLASCGAPPGQPGMETPVAEALLHTSPQPLSPDPPTPASSSGAACYIQQDDAWLPLEGEREAKCFERDNCSGGLGDYQPPNTCLKWATSADAPALPWSGTLTSPKPAEDVPPPVDIYEGSYEMTSDCHEKGCAYGSARFSADMPLYSDTNSSGAVVASIPAGECVDTEADKLLQSPRRGVVLETQGRFAVGDVIYLTAYEGEGYSTVWRRGEYLDGFQDEAVVRWDNAPAHPRAGYWIQVTRSSGQGGWVRDADIRERECNPARR